MIPSAATTFDIVKLMGSVGKMMGTVRIVSLLQPPPETVALFDEIILIDSGKVIYAGPVDEVVAHFESLGYKLPERTDVADWLLVGDGRVFECDVVVRYSNARMQFSRCQPNRGLNSFPILMRRT